MPDLMKRLVRRGFRRLGYDIRRWADTLEARRIRFLLSEQVSVVVDVGANKGQYGLELRSSGYEGKIVSFEPLQDAFRILEETAARDEAWSCHRIAVGKHRGEVLFNVAANSASSSILEMLPRHANAAPQSRYVAKEKVPIEPLDAIHDELLGPHDRIGLKLDVQGYEKPVLEGATRLLTQVSVLETELSVVSLYEDQALLTEMLGLIDSLGFELAWLDKEFADPKSGQILQLNGIFVRHES